MRKIILGLLAVATAIPALPAAADASPYQRWGHHDGHDRGRYARYYDNRGYYHGPHWRGRDGRNYCRRSDGTTGLLIGAVGGALVGRTIDTRGDRTTGTVLGGVAGALLGRSIDRDGGRCR